jgi:hypothetical protein
VLLLLLMLCLCSMYRLRCSTLSKGPWWPCYEQGMSQQSQNGLTAMTPCG